MAEIVRIPVILTVERKEESANPTAPIVSAEVAGVASDLLCDLTRSEWGWPWMVTDVELAEG